MLFSSAPYGHLTDYERIELGHLLSVLVSQHYRYTRPVFSELERRGVFLGNGRFAVAVLQVGGPVLLDDAARSLSRRLEPLCREKLHTPLYYALLVGGALHLILCYPRAENTAAAHDEIAGQLRRDFSAIAEDMAPAYPALQILISDVFWGEMELYLAANSLHHAMEYYAFRTKSPRVIQMDAEKQLHGAYVEDLFVYRRLSNRISEQMAAPDCDPQGLAQMAADAILENSGVSMESLHHHIQLFMLTFTERLSNAGLVDAAHIQGRHIVRRSMGFETEEQFRQTMGALFSELHGQYLTLSAIGNRTRIQQVRTYVLRHISDCNLSVSSLAEQFSITPSHLTRQFRRYFDETLHQFIQSTRLQYAKTLMAQHPDWPLQRVAAAAGYIDISTMYRAFQRVDGTTPGAIRRRTAGG